MTNESKFNLAREIRFYILFLLASFLLITGLYMEPPGEISRSVLIAAGGLVTVAACVVGVDVKGIIREYRLTKKELLNEES
jgi:hypothetical protein